MRALATCAALACALMLAGCTSDDESPEPVGVAQLPDNLCAAVPENVVSRWALVEDDHDLDPADDTGQERAEATCTMSGRAEGDPVTLRISLTSFGGADRADVQSRMAEDLAGRCAQLEASGEGRFTRKDTRCSTETGSGPDRGRVTEVSLSVPSHGVVSVSMTHGGPMWQLVAPEVVGLSGVVANSDPTELS